MGRHTGVDANTVLLNRFLDTVVGEPAVLFGNSMGGMVSAMSTHASPESVAGLVLVDPALPLPVQLPDLTVAAQFALYSMPYVGEQVLGFGRRKMSDRQLAAQMTRLCFADPTRADPRGPRRGRCLDGDSPQRTYTGCRIPSGSTVTADDPRPSCLLSKDIARDHDSDAPDARRSRSACPGRGRTGSRSLHIHTGPPSFSATPATPHNWRFRTSSPVMRSRGSIARG